MANNWDGPTSNEYRIPLRLADINNNAREYDDYDDTFYIQDTNNFKVYSVDQEDLDKKCQEVKDYYEAQRISLDTLKQYRICKGKIQGHNKLVIPPDGPKK